MSVLCPYPTQITTASHTSCAFRVDLMVMLCALNQKDIKRAKAIMYIQQSKEENPTDTKRKLQQDSGVSSTNTSQSTNRFFKEVSQV